MQDQVIRCFIALALPEYIKKKLADVQKYVKRSGVKASWAAPENFHLTLFFLGDQTLSNLPVIQTAMAESIHGINRLKFSLGQPGVFPGMNKPRVLWMGLEGELDALRKLHGALSAGLFRNGLNFKRQKFSPHITLARIKGRGGGPVIQTRISDLQISGNRSFSVNHIHLYESCLKPSGAVHTRLFSQPL